MTEITYDRIDNLFEDILGYNGLLMKEFTTSANNRFFNNYIFRGESSINNQLIPNALRLNNVERVCKLSGFISPDCGIQTEYNQIFCEEYILWKFYRKCDERGLKVPLIERLRLKPQSLPSEFFSDSENRWIPNDFFELAGLAQHYGLPTRLLDWSFNFFVAMYFALKNSKIEDEYCSIWAFNFRKLINFYSERVPTKLVLVVPEYSQNPNLKAQQGVFTHLQITKKVNLGSIPVDRRSIDEIIEGQLSHNNSDYVSLFYKINIPIKFTKELYKYLSVIGYDGSTLFPGYDGITRSMYEDSLNIENYHNNKNACP